MRLYASAGSTAGFVRRRSVASQPYRLVFRSVPRRPSPNLANLVARTSILADTFNHIHTQNPVIGTRDVRVATPRTWLARVEAHRRVTLLEAPLAGLNRRRANLQPAWESSVLSATWRRRI